MDEGVREMEEEEDCGNGCRFKGKELGSVFFIYVKIEFRETILFCRFCFFHVRKPLFK